MTESKQQGQPTIDEFRLARRDEILAACARRCDRAGSRCREPSWAEPLRAVGTLIARLAAIGPGDRAGAALRGSLADAAAHYGATRRREGQPADCLPYECSLVFESLWAAVSDSQLVGHARALTSERIQHALSLALMAALVGYELAGDPGRRDELDEALAQCCLRASPV